MSDFGKLDRYNLDDNCEQHGDNVDQTCQSYVKYLNKRESLKIDLERLEADISEGVRESPEDYGLEKITEKGIRDVVMRDPDYRALQDELLGATKKFNEANMEMRELDHRKTMLELLTKQWERGYYATVTKPAPSPEKVVSGKVRKVDRRRKNGD